MKIAYDGSGLTPPLTGVGNYIHQLLTHLLQIDHENSYWLLSHRRPRLTAAINRNGNAAWAPMHFPNRLVWMQCLLPLAIRALRPDVVHFPNFVAPLASGSNLIVTVHDVSLLLYPQLSPPRQRLLMRPFIQPSARRAAAIITVSAQSKREIVQTVRVRPEAVHVIYEAAAPIFHRPVSVAESERRLAGYGWNRAARHLLYVGTIEPRKNLEQLVRALQRLHRQGERAHLWIVGRAGWQAAALTQRARECGLAQFIHLTGYVPTADLRAFYELCDAFVFPSLYEGFGLPVIEAMACGMPVVLSDTPVLREIADKAAWHFDPNVESSIANALYTVMSDESLRTELRTRARVRAAQFSWERAARETLALYESVAARTWRGHRQ